MNVTEGGTPGGCGYRKEVSALSLDTDEFPVFRVRLRGRGESPRYRVSVEYTDSTLTDSGWKDADSDFLVESMELTSGKTMKYIRLYAMSNQASGTAYVDYDYACILGNLPIVPRELEAVEVDLRSTTAVSACTLRLHYDNLLGVTARRYSLDEGAGNHAYDLGVKRIHGNLVNTTWSSSGVHGGCLNLTGSGRLETGHKTSIPAGGALSLCFWVKATPGASGVICGFGDTLPSGWSRIQVNWSGNNIRLYVRDDGGDVLEYTSQDAIADSQWHHVVCVIDPGIDSVSLYIDGEPDGSSSGTLGEISLEDHDLTWGCLHTSAGYSNYSVFSLDEVSIVEKPISLSEAKNIYMDEPLSGVSRIPVGSIVMVYIAADCENQVYKIFSGRVIERTVGGTQGVPKVEYVCEDLGEILHERSWSHEYANSRWISGVVSDMIGEAAPELEVCVDQTDRSIINNFMDENCWGLLCKLGETAHYASGEEGANFFVDQGGALRFKKYGAFTCSHVLSDGGDGAPRNIQDITVSESLKASPRVANDVKVIIFEEETIPRDTDAWTESSESWSSPDPTDSGYPQSDTGDKQSGSASIHFNTTNPGSQYRMRLEVGEVDISGMDELCFHFKYGSGLSPQSLDVRIQKGGWTWTWDYRMKTGIIPPSASTWGEIIIDISSMTSTGSPGDIIDHIEVRAYRSTGDLGTGGFLIDKLRFIRNTKTATASDTGSISMYGRRGLVEVDKNITNITLAGYRAGSILALRKHPVVTVRALTAGRAQLGYRPPMMIKVTNLKDGLIEVWFQIRRALHKVTTSGGYTCELELVAARSPSGYNGKMAPGFSGLGEELARLRGREQDARLGGLRSVWR